MNTRRGSRDLDVAGRASNGPMCDNKYSVSFVVAGGRSIERLSKIVAHELGHIFHLNHDRKQVFSNFSFICELI